MLQRHGCDFPFSNLINDDGDDFLEKMVTISMQVNDEQNSILKLVTNQPFTSTGVASCRPRYAGQSRWTVFLCVAKLFVNCEPSRRVLRPHKFVLSLEIIINSHLIFDRDLLDMP
jgi:hypothetical protein